MNSLINFSNKVLIVALRTYSYLFFFQIKVVPGALDCWSFVSALEVLQSCELYEDLHNTELFYLYRATLWDHARKKVYL